MSRYPPFSDGQLYPTNLPVQRGPLVGRERELTEIRRLVLREDVGLVTLTGPGGAGKTRLALQVATNVLGIFPDGVYIVSLASASNPELIISSIARALGVKEAGDQLLLTSLRAFLRDKRLLLLLDNFEHLLDGAWLVADLLSACPGLTVLTTSRAALRLSGEHEYPVPPLALPDLQRPSDLETLSQTASVALFLRLAQAARPDFDLTEETAGPIAEICVRLDGLPLALELAAPRLKLLSPRALLARLGHRLQILTGGGRDLPERQRTLRDTIAWSYDLLPAEERQLFHWLSPFVGGFTLAAAASVGTGQSADRDDTPGPDDATADVLDMLASLVDKSLVRQTAGVDDEPRFEMLETIREYAAECLEASGEAEMLVRRHALYYLAQAEAAEPAMFGGQSAVWLARLEEEHDNLRKALHWTLNRGEVELALRLAGALAWFWYDRGHLSEGRHWLETVLAEAEAASPAARSKALIGLGGLTHRQYDLPSAVEHLTAGLRLSREIGDIWVSALALINLGLVAHDQGDYTQARRLHEESLALCREVEHDWGIGISLTNLSWVSLFTGDYQHARAVADEALSLRRDLDDELGVAYTLYILGRVALAEGDEDRTRALLAEGVALFRDLGDRWGIAACLETLAIASASPTGGNDSATRAARLWGAAEAMREALGAPLTPTDRRVHERHQAIMRARLDPEHWDAAWATGRTLPLDELLSTAMADPGTSETGETSASVRELPPTVPAGLTAREVEVLQLVSEGLSNAEVAERLHLSPRTVGQHLRSIYNKIGVGSRAAATRFAIEYRLV